MITSVERVINGVNKMKISTKDLSLIKKALRICMIKFNKKGHDINDIDSRILANQFEKVLEKTRTSK